MTPTTKVTRLDEKQVHDRAQLDDLLDSVHIAHVAVTLDDGSPLVLPTASARDGDRLLLHGSTGAPWLRRVASGAPVSVAITAFDGLVFARSAFESSIHYRSAVLFGSCVVLTEPDKSVALDVLTEALLPGRVSELRRPNQRELAATLVLALPIREWSLKVSAGWPDDPDADVEGPAWAGIVPARIVYGPPISTPDLRTGIDVAPSAAALAT